MERTKCNESYNDVVTGNDGALQQEKGRGMSPQHCAICLGACRDVSFASSCFHQFCFGCLLTWSKVKTECPLCKRNFKSIVHARNIRSYRRYEEHMVGQSHMEETTGRNDIANLTARAPRIRARLRYRISVPALTRSDIMDNHQLRQSTPRRRRVGRTDCRNVYLPTEPGVSPTVRRSPTSFRETIYRHDLWAIPLPGLTGQFKNCSPELYRYNLPEMERLMHWVNRELNCLLNGNMVRISYAVTKIEELLQRHSINSTEFQETMQRYVGNRTKHFLHELCCFASTPYDIEEYERNVRYTSDSRITTMVNEIFSRY